MRVLLLVNIGDSITTEDLMWSIGCTIPAEVEYVEPRGRRLANFVEQVLYF